MRGIGISRLSPIGLDLGTHSFKAAQVKFTGDRFEVVNHLSLPRTNPEVAIEASELARFKSVLDRRGFAGRETVIAIPNGKLLTAMLELPARAPGVPLEQIAAVEFARVHKKEVHQLTMSTWELPAPARASKATYVLGVGAASEELEKRIDLIETCGLSVEAVDEPHSAAARGCLERVSQKDGLVGIIDLGWNAARLTILRNQTIVYTRQLTEAGMTQACAMAAESACIDPLLAQDQIWQTGFDPAAAQQVEPEISDAISAHITDVMKEIDQAFGYASHRYSDSNMALAVLIGGGACIPGIAAKCESLLKVSTVVGASERADAGEGIAGGANGAGPGKKWDASGASISTALGLALWRKETR